jgi:tetratricopeptide (TPR) repeat protein
MTVTSRTFRSAALASLVVLAMGAPALAQETEPSSAIEAIRRDLDELRFDKAIQAIDALLASQGLSDATRVEALTLRASAHVASGDLDGAEEDYRRILTLKPDYAPDTSLTPKKALARFEKTRAVMVGRAPLDLRPRDARLTVDGRDVAPLADGTILLLAGERTIHAERRGFDPADVVVTVSPGSSAPIQVHLVPNARTVVVRTAIDRVAVRMDEAPVGETARAAGAPESAPAELVLEEVSIGEHVFELSKPCHRSSRVRVLVTVDLVDPSPLVLAGVDLAVARSHVLLSGGVEGAEVRVDGASVARLPIESLEVCAGERSIEVVASGRVLWGGRVSIPEGEETRISIAPRPNLALVGAAALPPALAPLAETFTIAPGVEAPAGADLSSKEAWERVALPPATDLAVGVVPAAERGGEDRAYLYSPILKRVYPIAASPPTAGRPVFHRTTIGARLVDSEIGGSARIVEVLPGGPASAAGLAKGDRILSIAGVAVPSVRAATEAFEAQGPGAAFPVEVAAPAGAPRTVSCTAARSPWLRSGSAGEVSSAILAAWAATDAVASRDDGQAALASLGLLLSRAGQHQRAAEVFRRVRLGDRPGIGDGTASYELGRQLAALGQEKEAREAFERAGRTAATAIADDGPPLRGAVADHLVDLGVARP